MARATVTTVPLAAYSTKRPLRRAESTGTYFDARTRNITVRRDLRLTGERITAIYYLDDCAKHGRAAGDVYLKHHKGDGRMKNYECYSELVVTGAAADQVDGIVDAYVTRHLSA